MARVTHVKHAQQRYEMVELTNDDGSKKTTALTKKDGSPKTTKRGKEIVRTLSVADKTKPLPNHICGKCSAEIRVGDPYKWIAPKSGPYGGRKMYRCESCPSWHVWEYSSSLSARLDEVNHNFHESLDGVESKDDVEMALNEAAEAVREIASEKEESANNIEEGFGHATSASEELAEIAEQLNGWADDIDNADIPEYPDVEGETCEECEGGGKVIMVPDQDDESKDELEDCEACDGKGVLSEPTQDQIDEWRSEVDDAVSIVDECPV